MCSDFGLRVGAVISTMKGAVCETALSCLFVRFRHVSGSAELRSRRSLETVLLHFVDERPAADA